MHKASCRSSRKTCSASSSLPPLRCPACSLLPCWWTSLAAKGVDPHYLVWQPEVAGACIILCLSACLSPRQSVCLCSVTLDSQQICSSICLFVSDTMDSKQTRLSVCVSVRPIGNWVTVDPVQEDHLPLGCPSQHIVVPLCSCRLLRSFISHSVALMCQLTPSLPCCLVWACFAAAAFPTPIPNLQHPLCWLPTQVIMRSI